MHLIHLDGRWWKRPGLGQSLALCAVHTSGMVLFFDCTWILTFPLALSFQIYNFCCMHMYTCVQYIDLLYIYLYIIHLDILHKYFNILCYFYIYIFSYIIAIYFYRCTVYKYLLALGVCRKNI